jgi:uncharacterized membrane protein YtjA (UPF0391 family)
MRIVRSPRLAPLRTEGVARRLRVGFRDDPLAMPISGGPPMLRLALLFLVLALIAALFGFNLVAGLSFEAARILFFVFLVLAVLIGLNDVLRRRDSRPMV